MNRIGVSELIWRPHAAEPGYVDRLLDEVASAGYEGVLLFSATATAWLDRAEDFRALLAARDLALVGVIAPQGVDFSVVDRLSA